MKNFKLTNGLRSYLIKQIQEMDLTEPKRVNIDEWKGKRGLPANALSWVFYDIIGKELGMLTKEVHANSKIQFGLPIIFARRDEYAFDLAETLDAIGFWDMKLKDQWRKIKQFAITSTFSTKEMASYIEDMQHFYGVQGICLDAK